LFARAVAPGASRTLVGALGFGSLSSDVAWGRVDLLGQFVAFVLMLLFVAAAAALALLAARALPGKTRAVWRIVTTAAVVGTLASDWRLLAVLPALALVLVVPLAAELSPPTQRSLVAAESRGSGRIDAVIVASASIATGWASWIALVGRSPAIGPAAAIG